MQTPMYFLVRVAADKKSVQPIIIEDSSVNPALLTRKAVKAELDPATTALYSWTFRGGLTRKEATGVCEGEIDSPYNLTTVQRDSIELEVMKAIEDIITATPVHQS